MSNFGVRMASAACAVAALCVSPALADDAAKRADLGDYYFGLDLGVGFMPSVSIKDRESIPGLTVGISGVEADVDPGVAGHLSMGFKMSDSLAVELELGYYRNGFGGFSGGEWTLAGVGSAPITGGDGNFTQIPLFVNGRWDIPIGKEGAAAAKPMHLELMAGAGVVNVGADISGVGADGFPGLTAAIDGSSWEIGAQLGVGLGWDLSDTTRLGVSYRMMFVSGASFGYPDFSDPALVAFDTVESDSVMTHAVQASLSIEF